MITKVSQLYAALCRHRTEDKLWLFDDQSGMINATGTVEEGGMQVYADIADDITLPDEGPAIYDTLFDVFVKYVAIVHDTLMRICFHQDGQVSIWPGIAPDDAPVFQWAMPEIAKIELQRLIDMGD